jgi:hypothetical protein
MELQLSAAFGMKFEIVTNRLFEILLERRKYKL